MSTRWYVLVRHTSRLSVTSPFDRPCERAHILFSPFDLQAQFNEELRSIERSQQSCKTMVSSQTSYGAAKRLPTILAGTIARHTTNKHQEITGAEDRGHVDWQPSEAACAAAW